VTPHVQSYYCTLSPTYILSLNIKTHATTPVIPVVATENPLTNIESLELDRLPDHLVVIGGGYVGLELAQAYRRFGSRVSIIEAGPQLAGGKIPTSRPRSWRCCATKGSWCISKPRFSVCRAGPETPLDSRRVRPHVIRPST